MGSSLACSYICQLSVYSTSFSLQVSGSYFLRLVGLPFEVELLQWNRDVSWIILGQHVNCACWEIPTAADVVWETGADQSFPDSALPWWIQHSCLTYLLTIALQQRAPIPFFSRNCHFVFRQSMQGTNVHVDVFSLRGKVCAPPAGLDSQSTGPIQPISHWAN